ncbi:MAG TPA: nucleoside-diphosphate sugar epimerase/dehydratase [Acidisarcina sp.]
MYLFKLTHGYWRYTGLGDMKDLVKAVASGSIGFFVLLRLVAGVRAFPYSIYIVESLLSFLMLASLRVQARMILQSREARRVGARTRVLIVGAGSGAALLLNALKRKNYYAVGIVDDDPHKQKTKLAGVAVVGVVKDLPSLAERYRASEILIAVPSATGAQMLQITDFCGRSGLPFRAVPSLPDLIDGKVTISEFREVKLDDLLGRKPVVLDSSTVTTRLRGRVVMVTGAAGSIGSELCMHILRCMPKKLICVDQAETPLFNLQQQVMADASIEIVYSVADITDTERMRRQFVEHDVRVVFHAAAYKHVPMTEANPYEGLKNNVFGLMDLLQTAELCGCEDFVLISSDKAVKPSSLMGCTKRLGEMIVGARRTPRTRCVSVRFGNVLGSQGSVIPVFQEQIRNGRHITLTHPQMTRYFMTIPEAASLVLQAFTIGEHGDILVLDMGNPIRILDLAKTLLRVSGKLESDVPIIFTGMRPGEKLHEELFYDTEVRLPTSIPKVIRAQGPLPDWNTLHGTLRELQAAAYSEGPDLVRTRVKRIITEYEWEPTIEMELLTGVYQQSHAGPARHSHFA